MARSKRNQGWSQTPEGVVFRKDVRKFGDQRYVRVDVGRTEVEAKTKATTRSKKTTVRKNPSSWHGPGGGSNYYDVYEAI